MFRLFSSGRSKPPGLSENTGVHRHCVQTPLYKEPTARGDVSQVIFDSAAEVFEISTEFVCAVGCQLRASRTASRVKSTLENHVNDQEVAMIGVRTAGWICLAHAWRSAVRDI